MHGRGAQPGAHRAGSRSGPAHAAEHAYQHADVPAIRPAQVNCWWNCAEVCAHSGYGHAHIGAVITPRLPRSSRRVPAPWRAPAANTTPAPATPSTGSGRAVSPESTAVLAIALAGALWSFGAPDRLQQPLVVAPLDRRPRRSARLLALTDITAGFD